MLHFAVCQQERQWEGYGTSQATVGHDELVLFGQLYNTEFINDGCETDHSWNTQKTKSLSSENRLRRWGRPDVGDDGIFSCSSLAPHMYLDSDRVFLVHINLNLIHRQLVIRTDPGLAPLNRGWEWKWRTSSSSNEDPAPWKRRGRWRWASRSRCSTSSGSIWWWCTICGRCWPPRMASLSHHTLSIWFWDEKETPTYCHAVGLFFFLHISSQNYAFFFVLLQKITACSSSTNGTVVLQRGFKTQTYVTASEPSTYDMIPERWKTSAER